MKEMVSFHDDTEKRVGLFIGLGAFLLSSVFALVQGLDPVLFLLRGLLVLIIFSLLGWGFGAWLKHVIGANKEEEEMPTNMERRSRNAEELDMGTLVMPNLTETVVSEEADRPGQVVNFTLPELSPMDEPMVAPKRPTVLGPSPASRPAMMPLTDNDESSDMPPPSVPNWLK
jgi:hypothetical protein